MVSKKESPLTNKGKLELFKRLFTAPEFEVKSWWPKGKDAIRVRTVSMGDVFFTYLSSGSWKLETSIMFDLSKDGI